MPYVDQPATKVRKDPLGPVTLNQAHVNIEAIDALVLREHFDDGQHNALEVPWIVGHITSGTTGYLFDTAYGGGTIARPATGRVTLSAASGVIGTTEFDGASVPAASVMANVNDAQIVNFPHVIEAEAVSATSIELRTRVMTSTLGSPGNSWSDTAVAVNVAVHAQQQPRDVSLLASHVLKRRRDFLTQGATDWNALAQNQGTVRKALSLEHTSAGVHNVNRIAKASGWFRPSSGPAFSIVVSHGVSSVSRISAGVVEVTLSSALSSTDLAACFPQAQPASADELVIVNGRCTSTTKFRFYIYVYSVAEDKWTRDDRSFTAAFFGQP
jgi:hypothetical protein